MAVRRGAGAVERGSLENCWPFTGPVSSNLTPAVQPRLPASSVAPGHLDDRSVQGEIRAAVPRRPGRPDGRRADRRLVHFRCRSAAASPASDHAAHADAPDRDRSSDHDSGRDDASGHDADGASSTTGSSGTEGSEGQAAGRAAASVHASPRHGRRSRARGCGRKHRSVPTGSAGRDEPGTGLPVPSRP